MSEAKPAAPTTVCISVGTAPDEAGKTVTLRKVIVIGRDAECDLVIRDVKASRRHCKITRGTGEFILEDLGSKNGTHVDGKRIESPVSIRSGQAFKVGDTVFYLM